MTSEGKRKFIFGALSCLVTACYSGKEDRGVENMKRNLSDLLTAELKYLDLETETLSVKVNKLREHTYQAKIEYNGKSIIIIIPPNPDIKGKVVPGILIDLGIKQKKPPRIRPRRYENYIQKPAPV